MTRDNLWAAVRQFFFGLVAYDTFEHAVRARWNLHYLFILAVMGELVGIPTRSYYSLRLLPYLVPDLGAWRRWLLRERDLTERMG